MTPMAMRLPAEQRRRQLLDVACDVFATSGFSATPLDDIATAAGGTKPVLYQHFPPKRAPFLQLLADPDASRDSGELAAWISELAWFGLRGIRPEDRPTLA